MSEKSLLIASDDPQSELSRSFERALRFLFEEKYNIDKVSYEDEEKAKYSKSSSSDILFILDTDSLASSYTKGIHFLRKCWAEVIKNKNDPPPVILLSFDAVKKLIRKDPRHIFACAEGIDSITLPFCLKDVIDRIESNAGRINIETAKKYLRWSCELKIEAILEHAWKNFESPYSLLRGACYVNDITGKTLSRMVDELNKRPGGKEANEEFDIYNAVIRKGKNKLSFEKERKPPEPLKKKIHDERILLIDDEYKTAGWKDTLETICGKMIKAIGSSTWQKAEDVLNDEEVKTILKLPSDKHLLPYDLILLDLRLTKDDENIDGMREANKFSGVQLLKEIRGKDSTIPVILFTASNKAYNIREAEKLKINGYFPKEVHYSYEDGVFSASLCSPHNFLGIRGRILY
ncbi:MAG: hypothetical protein AB1480_14630 [Nitrospirota bacterium]